MASGLWKKLKETEASTPVNIANGDVRIVEEIDDGNGKFITDTSKLPANARAPGPRPAFKPVSKQAVSKQAVSKQAVSAPPNNNLDLLGDPEDAVPPARETRSTGGGRPRVYADNAAKQKAYRERLKQGQA